MNRVRLREQMDREVQLFESRNPRSRDLAQLAQQNLVSGVPMPWNVAPAAC